MTSQCSEYEKKIAEFLLGDLNPAEQKELEQHLATCPRCRSEQAKYAETLGQLKVAEDEQVPRHFFVYPNEEALGFRQLFRRMAPGRQFLAAAAAAVVLLLGIASLSRLQVQVDRNGFRLNFGGNDVDIVALKKELLEAADAKNREARTNLIQEMRAEIAKSGANLSQQERMELTQALMQSESRLNRRLATAGSNLKNDSQNMIAGLYQTVSQQRARDFAIVNLRLDSFEANDAVKAHQTNEILDTLLQEAELRLR